MILIVHQHSAVRACCVLLAGALCVNGKQLPDNQIIAHRRRQKGCELLSYSGDQ